MAARKRRRKHAPGRLAQWCRASVSWLGPYARSVGLGLGACTLIAAALWGLNQSEGYIHRLRGLPDHVEFDLPHVPPGLEAAVRTELSDLQSTPWDHPALCQQVHARLTASGWVEQVLAVRKVQQGVVGIDCRYRQPLAPIQFGEYFYLIDESGFRLPGRYAPGGSDRLLIRGISQPPPEPHGPWSGQDLAAAVRLAVLLERQPFSHQIGVVHVDNYAGRMDRRRPQIELVADSGSRILWGSPPGEELEENSVQEKIDILLVNYRRYGRIDAQHATIDVSVFPDRYIIPG